MYLSNASNVGIVINTGALLSAPVADGTLKIKFIFEGADKYWTFASTAARDWALERIGIAIAPTAILETDPTP